MIPFIDSKTFSTTSLEEALMKSKDEFTFKRYSLPVSGINVTPDGHFVIQGNQFNITENGIKNVCSSLKIPNPFANRIPNELLIHNINALITEQDSVTDVFFNQDEQIVDLNFKQDYTPISNLDLLTNIIGDIESESPDNEKLRFMFEDAFLKVELGSNDSFMAAGDEHIIGRMIKHYSTSHSVTTGSVLIYTLVCANGMMAPRAFANPVRLRTKSSHEIPIILNDFREKLGEMEINLNSIKEAMDQLKEKHMEFGQIKKLINRFKRLYGEENIVSLVGDKAWSEYKTMKEDKTEDGELLTANFYDLYYNVTDFASNTTKSAIDSKTLQTFAGNLLIKYAEAA